MAKDPTEQAVANLFTMQRLANGVSADARAQIRALFDDIVAYMAKVDPTAPAAFRYRQARVKKLLEFVRTGSREAYQALHKDMRAQLAAIGVQQGQWAASHMAATIGLVGVDIRKGSIGLNLMKSIIDTDFVRGRLLKDWFADQARGVPGKVEAAIRMGMSQNMTLDQMIRLVRGRATGKRGVYEGGVMRTTTAEAESVIRTGVNQVCNQAHLETYKANPDITTEYQWLSTLDGRTSPVCRARDGQRYRYDDEAAPKPPAHWRCRSTIRAVIDWKALGIDPPPGGTRASADGQVPAGMNYEGWLKGQPKEARVRILGPGRAALFDKGKVNLRDMVRQDGSVVRVDQLRGEV